MTPLAIWDWNGTLLNDMDACVRSMNFMLDRRGLRPIDLGTYRTIFTFPVIEYYRTLGFDLEREDFDAVAVEFHEHYFAASKSAELQPGAREALSAFRDAGYRQIVLSATMTDLLRVQMERYDVERFFDDLVGADNLRARGKIECGREYFRTRRDTDPDAALLIGDTRHDRETASAIGCRCALVKNGHQDPGRFDFDPETILADDLTALAAAVFRV